MENLQLSKTAEFLYSTSFEVYKSNVCHVLKGRGDLGFLELILVDDTITQYYQKKWYKECLYLLAMVDYISKENGISLCTRYDYLRTLKLSELQIPKSVRDADSLLGNNKTYEIAYEKAIPEFLKYNIMEGDVRNVC
jgi:hypothetical protein